MAAHTSITLRHAAMLLPLLPYQTWPKVPEAAAVLHISLSCMCCQVQWMQVPVVLCCKAVKSEDTTLLQSMMRLKAIVSGPLAAALESSTVVLLGPTTFQGYAENQVL